MWVKKLRGGMDGVMKQRGLQVGAILLVVVLGVALIVSGYQTTETWEDTKEVVSRCVLQEADASVNFDKNLYALSAVLMDAKTGRVLYDKKGDAVRAMASTTKVMTCIVALEQGDMSAVVSASANAASQPKVHMGVRVGEEYVLRDLLYALMLESYNDAAVMIAEAVSGSVEAFAEQMNEKAKEIGAMQTHFVTPNGLDAPGHETTAEDLAMILRYAIQNPDFLEITQTRRYQFHDVSGRRNYQVTNHNSLFTMFPGTISGKTGYTGEAGYCYVGAVKEDEEQLIVALLGSGWPPHKTYKWADCMALFHWGFDHYKETTLLEDYEVAKSVSVSGGLASEVVVQGVGNFSMLISPGDQVELVIRMPEVLYAPLASHTVVGSMSLEINGETVYTKNLYTIEKIEEPSYGRCLWEAVEYWLNLGKKTCNMSADWV